MKCLPVEIVETIVKYAWSDIEATAEERRGLYHALVAAHPYLHDVVSHVVVYTPIFHFSFDNKEDIELYRAAVERISLWSRGPDSSLGIGAPLAPHIELDYSEICATRMDLPLWIFRFKKSLDGLKACMGSFSAVTFSSSILLNPLVFFSTFALLRYFPSVTHVHLNFPSLSKARMNSRGMPLNRSPIPSVRFLHITTYPMCNACPPPLSSTLPPHNAPSCPLRRLLHVFPNLTHLHVDTPFPLEYLDPPHTLKTLTLEAEPVPLASGRKETYTLEGYNIPGALALGLMRWPSVDGAHVRRTILVSCKASETYSYEESRNACNQHGIEFTESPHTPYHPV